MFKILFAALAVLILNSCAGAGATASDILDRLEFDCGETGTVELTTNLDLNPAPLISSNTTLIYKKQKEKAETNCPPVSSADPAS